MFILLIRLDSVLFVLVLGECFLRVALGALTFRPPMVRAVVVLWLLCQSMLLCSMWWSVVMPTQVNSYQGMTERDSSSAHAMHSVHAMHSAHAMHEQSGVEAMSTMAQSGTDAGTDCCSDQPDYLPAFSLVLAVAMGAVLFLSLWHSGQVRSKTSSYFFEPPPLYNFPRVHLLHCSLLH